ncbi:hypothetical protein [Microcoleus sp. Pol12B4]|uniref:hypothetical protein n=1 Tax=Microcoleus sp. Pol12B4 TaxID=3055395 RepID=UPI002FCF79E7
MNSLLLISPYKGEALNQFFLVTVTRMLGKLQQQGLISRDGDRHLILNKDAFAPSSDLFGCNPQAV